MPSLPSPTLHTERLTLRLACADDLAGLLHVHADAEVNRFLPYTTWQGMADAEDWFGRVLQRREADESLQLVIADRHSGQVLGSCLLFHFDHDSGLAEVGYALGRPHWGQGIMREALRALLAYAFTELGLRRLEAEVDPRNRASGQLLLRLGFAREGLLRQRRVMKGEIKDAELYGCLRDEWLALSPA